MNFIVYANDAQSASTLIDDITKESPCRSIVIQVQVGGDSETLTATPTIFCHPGIENVPGSQVCCEEIRLTAGRAAVERIPSAVKGLLLPDLPVYLYHEGDISLLDPILVHLGEDVDGVIVDSATFGDVPAGFRVLQTLLHN